ncbi:phage tail protein [Lactiplantibacillus plantarum]|uniref:phage tail protein n=1 Tax=Lactiplantibacillus plantarum TaxID=1590 RepID=UPI002720AC21|nr:phage tail protein [Lactiplantibacillus plantarum]MDO8183216.1 phage tail protein [Lactiplantibacillus plantarum]
MAESNATQVILTDDGIKIIKAQNTADNAASQASNADSAALIAQSMANLAKSAADSNYNYANSQMAVQSQATAKVQSTADNAFSQAQAVGSQASAEISSNSQATAKAQSTADSAFNQATTAIDNGKVTSQAITDLKGGSKLTIAELENGLATKVANSDYASYKVQTASQIAQKVDNGDFSTYKTQTAGLIAQKVATSDFSAYQATTAKSIDSKVSSNDFNTYKTQTAGLIDAKVSNSAYTSDKTQTASEIADRVSNSAFSTYKTQTASQIAQKVDNGAFSAYQTTTADLIAQKVATSDFSAYQATTAKSIDSKVASNDYETYKTQTKDLIASKVSKSDANNSNLIPYSSHFTTPLTGWTLMNWGATDRKLLVTTHTFYQNGTGALLYLNTAQNGTAAAGSNRFPLLPNTTYTFQFKAFASSNVVGANVYLLTRAYGSTNDYDTVHGLFTNLATSPSHIDQYTVTFTTGANDNEGYIRVDNIGSNNSASSGLFFTELKLELGDTATPYVYGGQDSMIAQTFDDVLIKVSKDDLIDEINLQAGNTLISSSGQLTLSGKTIYFDTVNPVIIPSANITGTLTGKTINAGTPLNQYGNTSYPLTINPDGLVATTGFNSMDGLRTEMSAGSFVNKYRAIHSSSNQYEAYDGVFSGNEIALNSGFTNGIDTDFKQSVSGSQLTGQVVISPLNGLHLWGSTQSIHFSGLQMNGTGITFNSYGNIIADQASTWWRVTNFSGSDIANFGTDTAGSNSIQFNRELDVGNFQINTGHTITSADNDAIHFAKGRGGAADIYAGAVNYTSLIKSSLLSVKKNVQKADTAYWAQLVNSIDLATYQYKTDDNTSHLRLSSIVDDVNVTKQWQLPDVFVARDENGKLNGVDDSVLLNATLATVQEQQKEIDQLNGHNMELEARLNKLEAKLNG